MASLLDRTSYKFEDIEVTDGAIIDKSIYEQKESRVKTLFIKAVIVYLLTAGSLGCFISAFDCEWHPLLANIVLFLTALLCTVLYYNYVVENIGYLIVFPVFFALVILFKDYINSGFYALVNSAIEDMSTYLDVDSMQQYSEKIENRTVTITVAAIFIGTVFNIVLNVFISRRMQFILPLCMVMAANLIPLYIEQEPDTIYEIMLMSGLAMVYVMRGGRHYRMRSTDSLFLQGRKKSLHYTYNSKSVWQTLIYGVVVVFLTVSVVNVAFPKDVFDSQHANNKYKESTMDTVSNFILLGIGGLFNYYYSNAGLVGGQLGGVSSIHLDHQTDIEIELAPYTLDGLYFKSFTGTTYLPYDNRWVENSWKEIDRETHDVIVTNRNEADALKDTFESNKEVSAKAIISVTNVEASAGLYLPYYGVSDGQTRVFIGQTVDYEVYPRFAASDAKVNGYYNDADLFVPEENVEAVNNFIEEAGLSGSQDEILRQLNNYFQANVPYTIKPGATPKNKDFINYFLTKNKKGYCAHFASSAVLILRQLGIPARYAEGYAVSYNEMLDDGDLTEKNYSDYYEGFSEIGETAVIKVPLTDADAHAWVEVYDEEKGWVVFDPTPAAGEEDTIDFWSAFQRLMNGNSDNDSEAAGNTGNGNGFKIDDSVMRMIAGIVLALFCAFILFIAIKFMIPIIVTRNEYRKADQSRKLVLHYNMVRKKLRRKNVTLREKVNYREELQYLNEASILDCDASELDKYIGIMEKAEFSNKLISDEEYLSAEEMINIILENSRKANNKS